MAACPQTESRTETISYTEFLTDPHAYAAQRENLMGVDQRAVDGLRAAIEGG